MHCCACDCELSDYESTRKSASTGEYLDMCNDCLNLGDPSDFDLIERFDLQNQVPSDNELEGFEDEGQI